MAEYTPSRLVRSSERHLRAENRSERTVENYLEGLHQAEVFLGGRGRRLEDATKADLEDFLADLLTRPGDPGDGLRPLLKACEGRSFEARRDTVLIMLLLDTGARRGELVGLKLGDVDLDLDVLLALGKGRRERALPFGHKALALDRYLAARPCPLKASAPPRHVWWPSAREL